MNKVLLTQKITHPTNPVFIELAVDDLPDVPQKDDVIKGIGMSATVMHREFNPSDIIRVRLENDNRYYKGSAEGVEKRYEKLRIHGWRKVTE